MYGTRLGLFAEHSATNTHNIYLSICILKLIVKKVYTILTQCWATTDNKLTNANMDISFGQNSLGENSHKL